MNKGSLSKKSGDISLVVENAEEVLVKIFGPDKAKLAKPLFLKNRTLTVTCHNSEIAQEIRLHQQEIVDGLNLKLGKNEVDRVRYLT